MEKELKIKISVDKKTGAINVVGEEFKELSNSVENTDKKVDSFSKSLVKIAKAGASLYVIKQAFDIATDISRTGMELESMNMSLEAAEGNAQNASRSIDFLKNTTDDLGLSFRSSLDGFTQFTSAAKQTALEGQGVKDVFAGVTKASAVMGLSVDDQNGVFRALSQMMSKGKIQAEELRGQLGERLPGAFQIAARSMGMTTSELDKFMADGKLISEEFLPNFAKQLEEEFGEKAIAAAGTARAEQARYNNALLDMKLAINEAGIDEFTKDFYQLGSVVIKEAAEWLHKWNNEVNDLKEIKASSGADKLKEQYIQAIEKMETLKSQEKDFAGMVKDRLSILDMAKSYLDSDVNHNAKVIKQKALIVKLERELNKVINENSVDPKSNKSVKTGGDGEDKEEKDFATSSAAWQKYYEEIGDYTSSWLIRQGELAQEYQDLTAEQFKTMAAAAKTEFFDSLDKSWEKAVADFEAFDPEFDKTEQDYNVDMAIGGLDDSMGSMQSMLDMQIALAESGQDWSNSLSGQTGALADIAKAYTKIDVDNLKYEKADIKLQEDYAKAFLEANDDIAKEKELAAKFDADQAELNQTRKTAEINGYASLAGAMGSAFEEGSGAAKAFQGIQATLGIANAFSAITAAWASAPFPANMPAVALTTAQMLPLIDTLTSLGGSGGGSGGGSASGMSQTEMNIQSIEDQYNPLLDELGRQTELLKAIERNGSAAALGVIAAAMTFERDYKIFVEESLEKMWDTMNSDFGGGGSGSVIARTQSSVESELGFNLVDSYSRHEGATVVDKDSLREGYNFAKMLEAFFTGVLTDTAVVEGHAGAYQAMLDKGWQEAGRTPQAQYKANLNEFISGYQDLVHDFTMSIMDSMNELKDASSDFKDSYDQITGSMYYENKRLAEAFSDLEMLSKGAGAAEYLKNEIENIDKLGRFLTEDKIQLLLLEDPTKLEEQIKLVQELEKETGITFDSGAKEALNYLDSIELVTESMAKDRENRNSYLDSFKSEEQLLQDMAHSLGYRVARNIEELNSLFNQLANDTAGLTDAELELLQANKSLIDSMGDLADTAIGNISSAISNYSNNNTSRSDLTKTLDTFSTLSGKEMFEEASNISSLVQRFNSDEQSRINSNYKNRIDSLKAEASAIKTLNQSVKSLHDFASSLYLSNMELSSQVSMDMYSNLFNSSFTNLSAAAAANNVDGVKTFSKDVRDYSQQYINSAKLATATKAEYELIVGSVVNKINGLDLADEASYETKILAAQNAQTSAIDALNAESVAWLEKVHVELLEEKENLKLVDSSIEQLEMPLSSVDMSLQELTNNTMAIEEVKANTLNAEEHYKKMEALLVEINTKLAALNSAANTVAKNTEDDHIVFTGTEL